MSESVGLLSADNARKRPSLSHADTTTAQRLPGSHMSKSICCQSVTDHVRIAKGLQAISSPVYANICILPASDAALRGSLCPRVQRFPNAPPLPAAFPELCRTQDPCTVLQGSDSDSSKVSWRRSSQTRARPSTLIVQLQELAGSSLAPCPWFRKGFQRECTAAALGDNKAAFELQALSCRVLPASRATISSRGLTKQFF